MLLCQVCAKSFLNNQDLNDHLHVHNGVSTFCEECGKHFERPRAFYKHKKIYHPKSEFTCDQCDQQFKKSDHLNRHVASTHVKKIFVCDDCSKSFPRMDTLVFHQKTCKKGRSETEIHICPVEYCKKEFRLKKTLKRHVKSHSVEENGPSFQCKQCMATFKQKYRPLVALCLHWSQG